MNLQADIIEPRFIQISTWRVLYNPDIFSAQEVQDWIQSDPLSTILQKGELICETGNAKSFILHLGPQQMFTKIYKPRRWYRNLLSRFCPASFSAFRAGVLLRKLQIPTPRPFLAAAGFSPIQKGFVQFLCTDYCENSIPLPKLILNTHPSERCVIYTEIAYLLAEFHHQSLYSYHLRSENILVTQDHSFNRAYWFIDLDRLHRLWWINSYYYIGTVSRALFEFFLNLPLSEQNFLLHQCFIAGVHHNIFKSIDQENRFHEAVRKQIVQRRGTKL